MTVSVNEIITVSVLLLNSYIIYTAFISERKRKFEDLLFEKKLALFQEIIIRTHEIMTKLDYNVDPFNLIHKFTDENEWKKFHQKEIAPLISLGMGLHYSLSKDYGLLLSDNIIKILDDFSLYATRMVIEASFFDGEIIIEKQFLMRDKRFELINENEKRTRY